MTLRDLRMITDVDSTKSPKGSISRLSWLEDYDVFCRNNAAGNALMRDYHVLRVVLLRSTAS